MFDCLDITAQTVGLEEVPSFVYLNQMPFQLPVSGYLSCRSNLTSIDREFSKIVLTDNSTGESLNNPALLTWRFLDRLKGHSQLWDRTGLDTTFPSLKSVYLNPKSNVRVRYI